MMSALPVKERLIYLNSNLSVSKVTLQGYAMISKEDIWRL
jgi:hypothetical protein